MRARFLILFIFLFSAPALFAQLTSVGCPTGHVRYYQDSDGDGYGKDSVEGCYTSQPSGYVIFGGDCNDNDASINPTTTWYEDQDNDGKGDPNSSVTQCVGLRGYVRNGNDQCPNEYAATPNGCPSAPDPDPDPEPEPVSGSFSDRNYVHMIDFTKPFSSIPSSPTTDDLIEEVTYLDGLGRPMQNLKINHAVNRGEFEDVITEIVYDTYGRQLRAYLPYSKGTSTPGAYQSKDLTQVRNFYWQHYPDDFTSQTATNAYSERLLEASPLGRVLKQAAPGSDWKIGSGHEVEFDYQANVSGSSSGKVRHFEVSLSGGDDNPTLISLGYYPAGALFKNVTRDENHTGTTKNHTTEEFTNRKGHTVLKRAYNSGAAHDTYYVYDDYGNLSFVLPPPTNSTSALPTTTERNELCYQYKYDQRNRLIEKKVPGKGWEYIVYNNLDQPILTQDKNLRDQGKWLYTKYDAYGRVVSTGRFTNGTSTQPSMQSAVNSYYTGSAKAWETKTTSSSNNYYTNQSYPISNIEVLTLNYYDNYTFNTTSQGLKLSSGASVYGHSVSYGVKGLLTGSRVKILDQATSKWITTLNHYDNKGRLIYTGSYNELLEVKQTIKNELEDISDNILKSQTYHKKGSSAAITIVDEYTYDYMTRLKKHTQSINGSSKEVIVENSYDELGQLVKKGVGNGDASSSRLQDVDYSYNVRGWLTSINDIANTNKLFNFKLSYNNPSSGTPLYNGNISRADWRTDNDDSNLKYYRYYYDDLNRITSASANSYNYSVSNVGYDKNGNIEHLTRRGAINSGASSLGNMDVLSYAYSTSSNKLKSVNDTGSGSYGFVNGADLTTEYTYDPNGNMKTDANKGITGISYNHLNLPTSVSIGGGTISYIYDATGVKQRKVVAGTTTDYADGFMYKNNVLQFFNHSEGYVEYDSGSFNYIYNYKDHLGNVRLSYSDLDLNGAIDPNTEILQERNFYPFGLEHRGYNNTIIGTENNFKTFQGQEIHKELGLNVVEFKWRTHDPAIGRFWQIDPLAEDYMYNGPYNFAENRVIDGIELEGLEHLSHTVYSVHKDTKGNYNASYDRTANQRNVGDWSGTKSQTTYNVYDGKGNVTAIYSGDNSQRDMNKAGVSLSSVKSRDVSASDIIEGAKNNKEFQKAGETLGNVGTVGGMVLSAGSIGGASLLVRGVLGADVIMGADDLTAGATGNGQTVMENTIGTDAASAIKTVVNTATATSGGFDAVGSYKAGKKANAATDAAGVVIDANSAKNNAQKVIKDE